MTTILICVLLNGNQSLLMEAARLYPDPSPNVSLPVLYGEPKAGISGYKSRSLLIAFVKSAAETEGSGGVKLAVRRL